MSEATKEQAALEDWSAAALKRVEHAFFKLSFCDIDLCHGDDSSEYRLIIDECNKWSALSTTLAGELETRAAAARGLAKEGADG